VLLLQDHQYLPSFGGGVKANRLLLEQLARSGHACAAVSRAVTVDVRPSDEAELSEELARRGIDVRKRDADVLTYRHRGVEVDVADFASPDGLLEHIRRRVDELRPDWVLVNDDRPRLMLRGALAAVPPGRVVLLLQTVTCLPFGPHAVAPSREQARLMGEVRAIVAISRFLQRYLERHGGLTSRLLRLPVYGEGPFPVLGRFDRGFITIVNPCLEKGVDVFLPLARALPQVDFAAVPTWGTSPEVRRALEREPNVRLLQPADDVEEILARTKVLLVPSLWPETFGYVVPEAMLRGIPVLASDVGGLPEAALGAAALLPVRPLERRNGGYAAPPQDLRPWAEALERLLSDRDEYERRSQSARRAALDLVATVEPSAFEQLLGELEAAEA
jgi:glycosyltransferase involved in cell wall biosynthesis